METMMQHLLSILTSSRAERERYMQMNTLLQELKSSQDIQARGMAASTQGAAPPQERPELRAIREALRAGNKMKAIQLYRSVYGVGLKEAQDALDAM